ncbi:jg22536, partial [Pararge aegeria aegeria]
MTLNNNLENLFVNVILLIYRKHISLPVQYRAPIASHNEKGSVRPPRCPSADWWTAHAFKNIMDYQACRLNQEIKGGAWCPKSQITTESAEWLEINLHTVHVISATGTQGRFGNGQGVEYAEAYVLEYWRPKLGKWIRYRGADGQEVLTGNSNTYLEKKNQLDPPIWASKIRFIPYTTHRRTICMRVELYGCFWS